jgi:hypothetical protein
MTNETALKARIIEFYKHLSNGDKQSCFDMVDPQLRLDFSKYEIAGGTAIYGQLEEPIVEQLEIHQPPSVQYKNREFATAKVTINKHILYERWIKEDGVWHTRCIGFIGTSHVSE